MKNQNGRRWKTWKNSGNVKVNVMEKKRWVERGKKFLNGVDKNEGKEE